MSVVLRGDCEVGRHNGVTRNGGTYFANNTATFNPFCPVQL